MKVLFLGDIFAKAGRNTVKAFLPNFITANEIDFVIANGENLANGRGVTRKTATEVFDVGVDVLTSGNHLWDKKEGVEFISQDSRILKPANYPVAAAGNNFIILKKNELNLCVICLIGQSFMGGVNYPHQVLDNLLPELKKKTCNIFVDFHAESTAEKRAMGFMFDGKISALVGTHTHIQTADEEVLRDGTAYITDAGMTGPHDSVIGVKKNIILKKMTTGMPIRYEPSNEGNQINGVMITIDETSGKASSIRRIREEVASV